MIVMPHFWSWVGGKWGEWREGREERLMGR